MTDPVTRRLKITSCTVGHTGTRNGHPFTVYEIKAAQESGAPIPPDMRLRSFTELPVGEVVEVEVEKYESQQYGTSYTLKTKKGMTAGRVNELTDRVVKLEAVVQSLQERLDRVEQQTPADPMAAFSGIPNVGAGGTPDDDIPF